MVAREVRLADQNFSGRKILDGLILRSVVPRINDVFIPNKIAMTSSQTISFGNFGGLD